MPVLNSNRNPNFNDFESFVRVKPAFFKYNLSLLSHRKAVVVFTDPEIRIAVGLPSDSEKVLFFDVKLTFDDQDFTEDYNGVSLQYVLAGSFPLLGSNRPQTELCFHIIKPA
ncbi:unnamed protein product [Dibothriocephalus latus]|uniref:KY-like immunoglobulin-like domain-containing protein n=1 Tax=Dibothriocephalus latus TaxID=60516 RepID=A0A3P7M9F2_DIBLA|nr:unnamed protein product [Dibothriocephalus latus]